ncbi:hypothetical protein CEXT_429151 [Caerostris extrusa]|uniref:Uncharacterized protein n=1 Tax=Caerostris extrusa TaxID=172846 RepID=A0AAV4MU23_CAEEX|nr:hypothetical protein CEXT_429151 [Caerostris extrusa]
MLLWGICLLCGFANSGIYVALPTIRCIYAIMSMGYCMVYLLYDLRDLCVSVYSGIHVALPTMMYAYIVAPLNMILCGVLILWIMRL